MDSEVRPLFQSNSRLGLPPRRQPKLGAGVYGSGHSRSSSTLLPDSEFVSSPRSVSGTPPHQPRRWSSLYTVSDAGEPDVALQTKYRPRSLPPQPALPDLWMDIDSEVGSMDPQWIQVYAPQGYRGQMALVPLSQVRRSIDERRSYEEMRSNGRTRSFGGGHESRRSFDKGREPSSVFRRPREVPPLSTESISPLFRSEHQLWTKPLIQEPRKPDAKKGLFGRLRRKLSTIFHKEKSNARPASTSQAHGSNQSSIPSSSRPPSMRQPNGTHISNQEPVSHEPGPWPENSSRRPQRSRRTSQLFSFAEEDDSSTASSPELQDSMY